MQTRTLYLKRNSNSIKHLIASSFLRAADDVCRRRRVALRPLIIGLIASAENYSRDAHVISLFCLRCPKIAPNVPRAAALEAIESVDLCQTVTDTKYSQLIQAYL